MQFTRIDTPRYSSEDLSTIDCDVYFVGIEGATPFTANKNDSTEHGVSIYNALVSGVYGPIADYVAPEVVATDNQPIVEGVQTL